jgi:ribonuclease-3
MSKNHKGELKEQADKGTLAPVSYSTKRVGGTDHEPGFEATARLPDGRAARGTGRSKVEAEQNAAGALRQRHDLP